MQMKWFNTKRGLQVIPDPNITEKMKEKIQTVQKMY